MDGLPSTSCLESAKRFKAGGPTAQLSPPLPIFWGHPRCPTSSVYWQCTWVCLCLLWILRLASTSRKPCRSLAGGVNVRVNGCQSAHVNPLAAGTSWTAFEENQQILKSQDPGLWTVFLLFSIILCLKADVCAPSALCPISSLSGSCSPRQPVHSQPD